MLSLFPPVLRQPRAGRLLKSLLTPRQVFLEWHGRVLGLVGFYVHWECAAAAVEAAAAFRVERR